uniref:Reverse transcriptase domain-containing protein n=1 Tax=Tanacetum cinerariifolium TaxID=118510 RepID=A0A699KGY0_TANCI|nr:reverse transcriptase domain-containing protein [Tanacetum cinerariifolium]
MIFPRMICRLERGLALLLYRFGIRESLAVAAAVRQTTSALAHGVDYGFIDTLDASIRATDERVMTVLEEVNKRMTDLAATHSHRLILRIGARLWMLRSEHYMLRFRELERTRDGERQERPTDAALMCGRMFPEESDHVEKYVGGLLDMIQGSVMLSKPKTMQEAIEFANDLMGQKLHTFAERQDENKRKLFNNPRDNQAQQQPFKRQNVARAYTVGPGEKKKYGGTLPLCTKCKYHHTRPCTAKCTNCKRVGHLARDCRIPAAANTQRAPG